MLSTSLFSQLFQHSVPGLIRPLSARNRKGPVVRKIFGGALCLTTLMYVLLGLVATLYFGDQIQSSINLNWDSFHWGYRNTDSQGNISVPVWIKIVNKVIVVVPALNTLSVFPLIAITLGNNLHVSMNTWILDVCMCFFGSCCHRRRHTTHRKSPKDTSRKQRRRTTLDEEEDPDAALTAWMNRSSETSKIDEDDDDDEEDDEKRLQRDIEKLATSSSFLYRLLAAIPPVVASAFIRDLSKTLAFSGLPALFVACVGPSLLQYYSSRACMRSLGTDRTRYSWHFSHSFYVYFMWIFSAAVSVIIVMQLIDTLHSN